MPRRYPKQPDYTQGYWTKGRRIGWRASRLPLVDLSGGKTASERMNMRAWLRLAEMEQASELAGNHGRGCNRTSPLGL